jgi:hypothetical protein
MNDIGQRRYVADFLRHNGTRDEFGQPTLDVPADWDMFVEGWPCEVQGAKGGEWLRGRQVTATSSHVLYGEFSAVRDVLTTDRLRTQTSTGVVTMGILEVEDKSGEARTMVIDAKRET